MEKRLNLEIKMKWDEDRIKTIGEISINGVWGKMELVVATKDFMEAAIMAIDNAMKDVKEEGIPINNPN